jgi:hypothetical protein
MTHLALHVTWGADTPHTSREEHARCDAILSAPVNWRSFRPSVDIGAITGTDRRGHGHHRRAHLLETGVDDGRHRSGSSIENTVSWYILDARGPLRVSSAEQGSVARSRLRPTFKRATQTLRSDGRQRASSGPHAGASPWSHGAFGHAAVGMRRPHSASGGAAPAEAARDSQSPSGRANLDTTHVNSSHATGAAVRFD